MLQKDTIENNNEISTELLKRALDGLQVALTTFGGPKGAAIALAIEGLEMIFDGRLDKIFSSGLNEIPELVEKLSGGVVNKKLVSTIMSEAFKSETIMKTVESVIKALSDLIVTYIIEPIKNGINLDSDKVKEFLNKAGVLAEPLKQLVSQIDKGIDNVLDAVGNKVKDIYKEVNQATDEFVKQYDAKRPNLKAVLLPQIKETIENKANILETAGKSSEMLSTNVSYNVKMDNVKIENHSNIDKSILNQAAQLLGKSDVQMTQDNSNGNKGVPKAINGSTKQLTH